MSHRAAGETWLCDCEWGFADGRIGFWTAFVPVVFCLVGCRSKERHHFWGKDPGLKAFMEAHKDDRFVSHSNVAEMSYLIRLGITPPELWWDTYVGCRVRHNRPGNLEASLISALGKLGLPHGSPSQKDDIRERILHLEFDERDEADRREITDYCYQDCVDCGLIYERIVDEVDPAAMAGWCRYLAAAARMEPRGVPSDAELAYKIWLSGGEILDHLFGRVNAVHPVFAGSTFSRKHFLDWASSAGIGWPWRLNERGRLVQSLDDASFKLMAPHHPFIDLVRQVKKTAGTLGRRRVAFDGRSGRHYFSTWPFRSITGRNQPKNFIFTGPKWMRHLIVPESPDHTLIYFDYVAEEIGIAAHLSGDPAMRAMYESDDAHLAFAKMAGAVPAGAVRADHEPVRDLYKTVNLGAIYWMTEHGIGQRLNIPLDEATMLLRQHRELFGVYWSWSRRYVQAAFDRGKVRTRFGWECSVPPGSKFRTWANWPIQAAGGDLMRLTVIYLDQQNIKLLAPVHDGFLISARKAEVDQVRGAVDLACRTAIRQVLDDFPLRWDWARYDEKFDDKKGREVWGLIAEALAGSAVRDDRVGIPPAAVGVLVRLKLRRPSSWRVLIALVAEAATSGGDAHLRIVDVARMTDLSERSVRTAVAELSAAGLVARVGRVGRLRVPMVRNPAAATWRAACFTARQELTVARALREAGLLLAVAPASIAMPRHAASSIGLEAGISFARARDLIRAGGDRRRARRFVGLVLEYRHSEAVGGTRVF